MTKPVFVRLRIEVPRAGTHEMLVNPEAIDAVVPCGFGLAKLLLRDGSSYQAKEADLMQCLADMDADILVRSDAEAVQPDLRHTHQKVA